jgi:hypothetical protein
MKFLDDLNELESNEKIIIYGSGSYAKILSDQINFHRNDLKVIYYLDRYKSGGTINSTEVKSLGVLPEIHKSQKIIVATSIKFWGESLMGTIYILIDSMTLMYIEEKRRITTRST